MSDDNRLEIKNPNIVNVLNIKGIEYTIFDSRPNISNFDNLYVYACIKSEEDTIYIVDSVDKNLPTDEFKYLIGSAPISEKYKNSKISLIDSDIFTVGYSRQEYYQFCDAVKEDFHFEDHVTPTSEIGEQLVSSLAKYMFSIASDEDIQSKTRRILMSTRLMARFDDIFSTLAEVHEIITRSRPIKFVQLNGHIDSTDQLNAEQIIIFKKMAHDHDLSIVYDIPMGSNAELIIEVKNFYVKNSNKSKAFVEFSTKIRENEECEFSLNSQGNDKFSIYVLFNPRSAHRYVIVDVAHGLIPWHLNSTIMP